MTVDIEAANAQAMELHAEGLTLIVEIESVVALAIIMTLQLACKHPHVDEKVRDTVTNFAKELQRSLMIPGTPLDALIEEAYTSPVLEARPTYGDSSN